MSAYQYAVQNEKLFPTYFRTQKEAFAYAKEIGGRSLYTEGVAVGISGGLLRKVISITKQNIMQAVQKPHRLQAIKKGSIKQ